MMWWKNKELRPGLLVLGIVIAMALGRDILANGRPLYCRIDGERYYPGLRALWKDPSLPYGRPALDSIQQNFLWRRYDYDEALFAPVPFSPGELPISPDTTLLQAPPGTPHPGPRTGFCHWLGTDTYGYDVAAGLVGGARIALLTGAIAMGIALLIGVILGAIAGYWGDDRLRLPRGRFWLTLAGLPLALFYAKQAPVFLDLATSGFGIWWTRLAGFGLVLLLCMGLGRALERLAVFRKPLVLPADLIIMRLAEVFTSLPGLLVIVAFAAMLQEQTQTLWAMTALIGAFSWPGVALFLRAELLRIRALDYITAARGIGLSEWRILVRHALPNALRPVYTIFAFGVAGAILLEASIAFLGYGDNSLQGASWGSLLQNAKSSPQLWWISLPPGLAICLTILALQSIGEYWSERR